jgi:hypothetical protein
VWVWRGAALQRQSVVHMGCCYSKEEVDEHKAPLLLDIAEAPRRPLIVDRRAKQVSWSLLLPCAVR